MKILCGICCFVCFSFLGTEIPKAFECQSSYGGSGKIEKAQNSHADCNASSCTINAATKDSSKCSTPSGSTVPASTEYSDLEKKVIQYICDVIEKEKRVSFEQEEVEKAIGGPLPEDNPSKIQAGVMAELQRRNFDMASLPASRCMKYNACSINMDLSYATGPERERYEKEKDFDGKGTVPYLPKDFTLASTKGKEIQLSKFRGKPVAIVFLAVHCSHSWDTLPILDELTKEWDEKIAILPVFTNSGSVEDVQESTSHKKLALDFLVAEGKTLSEDYDSLIVPSTFLINKEGKVTKRLVGFKNKSELEQELVALTTNAKAIPL